MQKLVLSNKTFSWSLGVLCYGAFASCVDINGTKKVVVIIIIIIII